MAHDDDDDSADSQPQQLTHEEMDSVGQVNMRVTKREEKKNGRERETKLMKDPAAATTAQDPPYSQQDSSPTEAIEANDDDVIEANRERVVEPMEMEQNEEEEERNDDDLEALLENSDNANIGTTRTKTSAPIKKKCCKTKRVGNISILCQRCHSRTGYGIVGPHWFGPWVVFFLVAWASWHFVRKAYTSVGPISTAICLIFFVLTVYYLFDTSFKDPGIVMVRPSTTSIEDDNELDDHRWCDFCNVYQPPDGAHCPDCNVCIAGYDHHCVWMGVCIGKGNMKSFVRFNMCWILYLLYASLWVSLVGPLIFKHHL
jgi:hypothetical protein